MNNNIKKALNFIGFGTVAQSTVNKRNLNSSITPIQLQRISQDTGTWRLAVEEAERAYFPFRVQMQTLFIDTILNGQVKACVDRRKDLTLLRDFQLVDKKTKAVNKEASELLSDKWFSDFTSLALDALFYGYSLISLGDITDGKFKNISTVRRWNVSPDRLVVSAITYATDGISFLDPKYKDFHVYVKTPNEIGTSLCGYGLLYNVGIYEIFLRNILGYNGDFVELFSQPYRIGTTSKSDEAERNEFENAVANMASSGYMIKDSDGDTVEFLESDLGGTGWQGYENLEQRLEKKISKIILGHADALDSVAGTLGATQGAESPTSKALSDKQTKDGVFITDLVNEELLPRLRRFGFNIPEGLIFEFKNDTEVKANNASITALAVEIKKAGLQMDAKYYEEQTGIKLSEVVNSAPTPVTQSIKNKLEKLYK